MRVPGDGVKQIASFCCWGCDVIQVVLSKQGCIYSRRKMASFYSGSVKEFLEDGVETVIGHLAVAYANLGYSTQYSDQTLTWERDLNFLRQLLEKCIPCLPSAKEWGLLLEFSIPRKNLRIDVVLLVADVVVLIEAKAFEAFD